LIVTASRPVMVKYIPFNAVFNPQFGLKKSAV
jgi:hypothetical protein